MVLKAIIFPDGFNGQLTEQRMATAVKKQIPKKIEFKNYKVPAGPEQSTSTNLVCFMLSDDDSTFDNLGHIPRNSEAEIVDYGADIEFEARASELPIVRVPVNDEPAEATKCRSSARIAAKGIPDIIVHDPVLTKRRPKRLRHEKKLMIQVRESRPEARHLIRQCPKLRKPRWLSVLLRHFKTSWTYFARPCGQIQIVMKLKTL